MSLCGVIVEGDDDNRTRRRKDCTWVSALIWITRHPIHLAVKPAQEPFLQSLSFNLQRFGANDSHFIKAFSSCVFFDLLREEAGINCIERAHDLGTDLR